MDSKSHFKKRGVFRKAKRVGVLNIKIMVTIVKIIVSIIIGLIGFLCLGLWPYIPGPGILISIGLFASAMIGIRAVWAKKKVEGEGDIFKNRDKLNKD